MKTELLDAVESKSLKKEITHFEIGDIVEVSCRIKEGDKERIQIFSGTVIARKGRGINTTFTVRRVVGNEGVERIFPIHSPRVTKIVVKKQGKVRRAKLYYLRRKASKAIKAKEKAEKIDEAIAEPVAPPNNTENIQTKEETKEATRK